MLERGVARTTIEDIQDAAHVSASQLYHYFADKDALVLAVIAHQTDAVISVQHQGLAGRAGFTALEEWRNLLVSVVQQLNYVGGCPIGSLAADLAETNPDARRVLANSFAQWEGLLRETLASMRERGELRQDADTDQLALALLATVQGGLLLSQTRRDTLALEAAIDTSIAYLHTLAPK
jgi:AcrR family transcriptional regulator